MKQPALHVMQAPPPVQPGYVPPPGQPLGAPGYVAAPPPPPRPLIAPPNGPNDWVSGICDCCDEMGLFCLSCWCPCIPDGVFARARVLSGDGSVGAQPPTNGPAVCPTLRAWGGGFMVHRFSSAVCNAGGGGQGGWGMMAALEHTGRLLSATPATDRKAPLAPLTRLVLCH